MPKLPYDIDYPKNERTYKEVEISPGTDITKAINIMTKKAEEDNELKYIVFNGRVLHSDVVQF